MSSSPGQIARMRRKRRDILAGAPAISGWSAPRPEDIPQADQATYYANKLAVEMWAKDSTETAIINATRLNAADARRIAERCVALNKSTGSVHGFWACLPNRRLERAKHTRRRAFNADLAKEGKGRTGALNDLFKRYPSVAKGMLEFALKRRVGQGAPAAIATRAIVHETFIALCKIEGLDERNEWPFDASRRGTRQFGSGTRAAWRRHQLQRRETSWGMTQQSWPRATTPELDPARSKVGALLMSVLSSTNTISMACSQWPCPSGRAVS